MKGFYGNIGVLISDSSLSPEAVSDISNLGSVSSNWNPRNVKDYEKNSSDSRLVLKNLELKNNHRLIIENLNINSISNKFDKLKLITQGKIQTYKHIVCLVMYAIVCLCELWLVNTLFFTDWRHQRV